MPDGETLDLECFRLPPHQTAPPKPKPPRYCKADFLRGPIPWSRWLVRAIALPGKALAVALVLWREAGIRNSMTVPVQPARLREAGILPDAARRALCTLEVAGLVKVRRPSGRCREVTILSGEGEPWRPTEALTTCK